MKTGRPSLYNERMVPHYVGLPPTMARAITEYGDGNLARGVRKLWLEHAQRVKVEQTKDWERDWRSNPTASSDPPHEVISEPGQEMLPPPSDPTTPETAVAASECCQLADETFGREHDIDCCGNTLLPDDPREDSGALEAIALDADRRFGQPHFGHTGDE